MVLKTITIQNFLSVSQITLNLDNMGLVLLLGQNNDNPEFLSNGAGKSSITEALVWVLYGKTVRGLKGDEVVHNLIKKNCKVILDLVDDDGNEYRLARYRKHNENKNSFQIFMNKKDVSPKSDSEGLKFVVELLGMDYTTFTAAILYSASSFKFTSASDSELKAAFDTILGFDIYSNCLSETRNKIRQASGQRTQVNLLYGQISKSKQVTEDNLNSLLDSQKEWKQTHKATLSDYLKQIKKLEKEKTELESQVEEFFIAKEQAKKAYEDLKAVPPEENSEIKKRIEAGREYLQKEADKLENVKSKFFVSHQELRLLKKDIDAAESSEANLENMLKTLKEDAERVEEDLGTECPHCGQVMDSSCLSKLQEGINKSLAKTLTELTTCKTELLNQKLRCKDLEEQTKTYKDERDVFEDNVEKAALRIKDLEKQRDESSDYKEQLAELKSNYSTCDSDYKIAKTEFSTLESQLSSLLERMEQEYKAKNPYEKLVVQHEEHLAELRCKEQEYVDEIEKLDIELEKLRFWEKAFSNEGIKSKLLDNVTPYLNKQANRYLQKLSSDHIEVKFTTQTVLKSGEVREKFNIEIINMDGGMSYASNSSGEKKRIDIAIQLALQSLVASRSSKQMNILILDEIFDALDDSGIANVMNLLDELSQSVSSILVITHNEELASLLPNTITVEKTNGLSKLVEGK